MKLRFLFFVTQLASAIRLYAACQTQRSATSNWVTLSIKLATAARSYYRIDL